MQSTDVIATIASYLDLQAKEATNLILVSKQFQIVFESDAVWYKIWNARYPLYSGAITKNYKFCYSELNIYWSKVKNRSKSDVKVYVMGAGGVGKSTLIIKLTTGHYVEEYDPTIEDSYRKAIKIGNEQVTLDILDSAGPEEFYPLISNYIRSSDYVIICYDCTSRSSFDQILTNYYNTVRIVTENHIRKPKILIVECKRDKDVIQGLHYIDQREGIHLAESINALFVTTSALSDINVDLPFRLVAEDHLMVSPDLIERLSRGEPISQLVGKKKKCIVC
ncbi:hypothetical protein AKO1_008245 [Acrasis kona]|uniref:Uncharacterized protein n=1 Tax=Acrasis kona TaxID=1008807 RepID=A0AAW2YNX9_9EUKA